MTVLTTSTVPSGDAHGTLVFTRPRAWDVDCPGPGQLPDVGDPVCECAWLFLIRWVRRVTVSITSIVSL
eukprot:2221655-Pyramimonas_sp.AAC.1